MKERTESEQRARIHVAYTYFLKECLRHDEAMELYECPSRNWKLIVMHEMDRMFDYDLQGIPGFFYDIRRTDETGGWMVNTPEFEPPQRGFIKPVVDSRGRITALHIVTKPRDPRPKLLTSKGLPLGS